MAATGSEAIMIELMKDGWEWIKSERYHKKEAEKAKKRELKDCDERDKIVVMHKLMEQQERELQELNEKYVAKKRKWGFFLLDLIRY